MQEKFRDPVIQDRFAWEILASLPPKEIIAGLTLPKELDDLCTYLLTLRGNDPEDIQRKPFCECAKNTMYLCSGSAVPCSQEGLLKLWEKANQSEPRRYDDLPAHFRQDGEHVPFVHNEDGKVPVGFQTFEPSQIPNGIDALLGFMARTDLPLEVKAFCAHFQLVHIHPFCDGNGHLARMLMCGILSQRYSIPTLLCFLQLLLTERNRRLVSRILAVVLQDNDLSKGSLFLSELLFKAQYIALQYEEA